MCLMILRWKPIKGILENIEIRSDSTGINLQGEQQHARQLF